MLILYIILNIIVLTGRRSGEITEFAAEELIGRKI